MSVRTHYRFQVNQNLTWQHRIGWALRRLATWVDRRISLAVHIETTPRVPPQVLAACVKRSLGDMERYIVDAVQTEACEQLLRFSQPELYRESA